MEEELKQTCLYDKHVALGAMMKPFGGFMMPIQYSTITDEHQAVRNHVGMFDVSHMGEIFVNGPDAAKFVNHIFTNDIEGMADGQILYGMMCYPDGGTVDDLLVYKEFTPDSYLLVVNAANIDKDDAWIRENSKAYDVVIDNQSPKWGQLAIQGPEAEAVVEKVTGLSVHDLTFYTFRDFAGVGSHKARVIISRTGYTGEDGFEIYSEPEVIREYWDAFIEAHVVPCGLGCRDTLRFETGLPLYGDELSKDITPVMAGLSIFCKFEKKEFIGKEALEAQKENKPAKRLVGIELHDRAIPRAGYPVELEDGTQVGVVTTGYHSITLDKSLCFALVDTAYSKLGTPLMIRIRKKVFPGTVVKKRFYQANYKK
jgi:aminomethyltransferase